MRLVICEHDLPGRRCGADDEVCARLGEPALTFAEER
jgi:hypothetical protein